MRSANGIDKQVGANLLKVRQLRGFTQENLADAVGVTFQQIQKYEQGRNRISVSRLWQLSQILKIPVENFFAGIEGAVSSDTLKLTAEQLSLIKKYDALQGIQKKALQEFIRFLWSQRSQQ